MEGKLIISQSPHFHCGDSVRKNMYAVVIALIPALIVSLAVFGMGAFIVTATSVAACLFFEWSITKYIFRKPRTTITDGSAIVTGLLLAFNLPSNLPLYIIIVGALVAIGIGKMTFGGLGNNPFNPALVGRVFLLVSFPAKMTTWPTSGQMLVYIDAVTGATPLGLMKEAVMGNSEALSQLPGLWHMFIGNITGCLGEVSVLALLLGFAYLLVRKVITWHIPVSIITTVLVFSGIMWIINPIQFASPMYHILAGGLMLGAIFMATDYVTSPMTPKGMVYYGIGIGFITAAIRYFGSYPEGMSFAILLMNAVTPLLNRYCKPKRF